MGDPKKTRKKYDTPTHPWQKTRIENEITLKREFGLRNKKEIWKAESILNGFKQQIKTLNALSSEQADKEKSQLREKLLSLGLLKADQPTDSILGLEVKNILERRFQTVLFKKNLAKTINQARQFIVHRHVKVADKKISVPSHLIKVSDESKLSFSSSSSLANTSHPERFFEEVAKPKVTKKKKEEVEEVVAFEKVPENEDEIAKEIETKKNQKRTKNERFN
ncbi:30S ribosomal protein S4 [Candidatus Woesearchaeota archaeon]|jgi:small subunit ribosomal protein S4|nr:30S ribosomal protein S4 [Candidatus Woesearchaeota archaeon]|tara:strand:- start:375 stop:1040 length:666 start_codon:yes stop_codon:yes gene_type:complete